MGEAKRRKALGLMPTPHPFTAELGAEGDVILTRGPEDAGLRARLLAALRETQPFGEGWAEVYRQRYVMAGRAADLIQSRADLEQIPVPERRRISGELTLNLRPESLKGDPLQVARDYVPLGGDAALHLTHVETSADGGESWQPLPQEADARAMLEALTRHPLARERGELLATYHAEQWREGRLDLDPEPPGEDLEALEAVVREWHGETPEEWADLHGATLDLGEEEDDLPVPIAVRSRLELRGPPLLTSPYNLPFADLGAAHVYPARVSYTLDGETWLPYGETGEVGEEAEAAGELGEFLGQMLDVDTVPVTVWADGRVEWAGEDVPAEHAERLRADLLAATGAGNAEAWADFTEAVLRDMFSDDAPHLAELERLPVPRGMKIDIPTDSLTDPDDPAQYFIESEVSFDGETWRDLYAEDVPPELAALAPPSGESN